MQNPGPVGRFLKSLVDSIRTIGVFSSMDDAGIGLILNFVFLMTVIVIHFTSYFLSDFNDTNVFDRMAAHDLATNCKFMEEQLKTKDIEINRLLTTASQSQGKDDNANELREELCWKNAELQKLLKSNESLKLEVDRIEKSLESTTAELVLERTQKTEAQGLAADCKRLLEESEKAHLRTTEELTTSKESLKQLEQNLEDERRSNQEFTTNLKIAKEKLEKLRKEFDVANNEISKLKTEKSNLELENVTLSGMIEEMDKSRKEGSAGESGGSGGWSDFGDDFNEAEDEKEKTPASSTVTIPVAVAGSDVREAAKLRAQLKKSQQELDSIRVTLDSEREERRHIESKLKALKAEAEKKTKEVINRYWL
ncbi:unnamed protein product [Cylicostephanus goldi]|uniref:Uncharacterized protein n=1 Tax=Cylicostephanus goldi TaxID=71465 RepID=A0A3P6RQD3_CYLGO|nr:unnamed protein product [Cylicostephanus goldi]